MTLRDLAKAAVRRIIDAAVVPPARRVRAIRYALAYAAEKACPKLPGHSYAGVDGYEKLKGLFLNHAAGGSRYDRTARREIIDRFERVDREIDIQSTATDGLFLAEALLALDCPGAVVECGCFNGGSTAKLSILARLTGRRLFVFDSFEGLPQADADNIRDFHARRSMSVKRDWAPGEYAASLERVRENVKKYGEIDVCTFVKGWFSETLATNLPEKIALAFTDVDLPSSAKECLIHIWPRLSEGGVFFSHDIAYIKVLQNFFDDRLWRDVFQEPQPVFWGAGYGMGDSSPHLGFAVKGRVTAEYIKNLTPYK
ncbi:MAG TPA: TylF/MycF/NovP-related O-methyltransferase [Candidatus Acidoferrales bacterium]|nr:TylF/MycF/NovP-related O-methyltransferase [Candidatus Acidoferrales bacterium]